MKKITITVDDDGKCRCDSVGFETLQNLLATLQMAMHTNIKENAKVDDVTAMQIIADGAVAMLEAMKEDSEVEDNGH